MGLFFESTIIMNIDEIKAFKSKRITLPEDYKFSNWNSIQSYFEELQNEIPENENALKVWLKKWSELDAFLDENMAWRYIKMTCNTIDDKLIKSYDDFVENIMPNLTTISNTLNKNLLSNPYKDEIKNNSGYKVMLRGIEKEVALFRPENIRLQTQEQLLEKQYNEIAGAMTVVIDGKEMPLPVASTKLESQERKIRETAWKTIGNRRLKDKDKLDTLFNEMLKVRTEIAKNAGYENYTDYKFDELGRFDYSKKDCFKFHSAIEKIVVPIVDELMILRKNNLKLDQLRPWDTHCDLFLKKPLKPFTNQEELVNKTIDCFQEIDPYFAECISTMKKLGHLDLESRKGKAPGGYNYPLNEIGIPFIFMNAAGTIDDVITMVHEGGHAIHSFLTRDLELTAFKNTPSEVAELASMTMELISMDHWHHFFLDTKELNRAKLMQLERIITVLPWVATVDAFQHWIYQNPEHTTAQRDKEWINISQKFSSNIIDKNQLENYNAKQWHKQLHIFEVPFYYIEYGMAQLGAIAIWKNYKENPDNALKNYKNALSLGYTKTIPEIFETAGISFDYSAEYIKSLMNFIQEQWKETLETL